MPEKRALSLSRKTTAKQGTNRKVVPQTLICSPVSPASFQLDWDQCLRATHSVWWGAKRNTGTGFDPILREMHPAFPNPTTIGRRQACDRVGRRASRCRCLFAWQQTWIWWINKGILFKYNLFEVSYCKLLTRRHGDGSEKGNPQSWIHRPEKHCLDCFICVCFVVSIAIFYLQYIQRVRLIIRGNTMCVLHRQWKLCPVRMHLVNTGA